MDVLLRGRHAVVVGSSILLLLLLIQKTITNGAACRYSDLPEAFNEAGAYTCAQGHQRAQEKEFFLSYSMLGPCKVSNVNLQRNCHNVAGKRPPAERK